LWDTAVKCGWAAKNIVDVLEPIKRPPRVKKLFANLQTLRLLAACLYDEETLTYLGPFIMGSHGCMRPDEIMSDRARQRKLPKEKWFGWHSIDFKHAQADVSTDVAKLGDERVICLQPMVVEWLQFAKKNGSEFPPTNWAPIRRRVFNLAGIPKEERIRDGLRHNCATHLRVIYKNDYDVIKDLGNSVRTLLKDYADLKTPKEVSLEHWGLTLEKVQKYVKSKEWKDHLKTVTLV
jgi:hypothetical protein